MISVGQQSIIDPRIKHLLDSLDNRIAVLNAEMPAITKTKDVSYYYKKRELDLTRFYRLYEEYVFEEDLDMAEELTMRQLEYSKSRKDNYSTEVIEEYFKRLKNERKEQLARYKKLFAKEKNFKKEFESYLKVGDLYALRRAKRMTELAIKYANQQKIESATGYLPGYLGYIDAVLFDYESEFDLSRLTRSESNFEKKFIPLVSSDSISHIMKAKELVENCYNYAASTKSILDTGYFELQRNVVATSISDYYERKGVSAELAKLTEQSVIARLDTLNREGVYKWHDKIIVIGTLRPSAKFTTVKKGEAIIKADQELLEYVRVNKIMKLKKEIRVGTTFLIPFNIDDEYSNFHYNRELQRWQYMVCYTQIVNKYTTKELSKFLPPMIFQEEENFQ